MKIDPSRLFAIEAVADDARAAFVAATARRDRAQGWLDAQRRRHVDDGRARPATFLPPAIGAMSPEAKRHAMAAAEAEATIVAERREATARASAAAITRLETDLRAAAADVERAAQAQAQTRALAEACRKLVGGPRHG